jgi:hypothetical protein
MLQIKKYIRAVLIGYSITYVGATDTYYSSYWVCTNIQEILSGIVRGLPYIPSLTCNFSISPEQNTPSNMVVHEDAPVLDVCSSDAQLESNHIQDIGQDAGGSEADLNIKALQVDTNSNRLQRFSANSGSMGSRDPDYSVTYVQENAHDAQRETVSQGVNGGASVVPSSVQSSLVELVINQNNAQQNIVNHNWIQLHRAKLKLIIYSIPIMIIFSISFGMMVHYM